MININRIFMTLLSMLLGLTLSFEYVAYAGTATAELDKTIGTLEDQFQLTIAINGSFDGDAPGIDIPGVDVGSAGTSRSMQWINGKYSSEILFTYLLIPRETGKFQVPSVKVIVDKQEIATLPINFEVRGTGHSTKPGPKEPQGDTGEVFIERELSTTTPYVGEGVLSTVRVYHRVRLTGGTPQKEPAPDFRFIPVPGEKNYQQIIGGKRYGVIELKEVVVPLRAGAISLPPFGLNATLVIPTAPRGTPGSIWDMLQGGGFGMGREVQKKIVGQTTPLQVRPVPETGKPEGYAGLIGDFRIKGNVSKTNISAGDTVTITISVDGAGLLDTLDGVKLKLDHVGKVYPDKPMGQESFTGDVVKSSRELKYALVPQRSGSFDLGAVEIPVFNSRTGAYEVLRAELGSLSVAEGAASGDQNLSTLPAVKSKVKILSNDLLAQHPAEALLVEHRLTPRAIFIFSSLGLSTWLLGLGVLGFRGVRSRLDSDGSRARRQKAHRKFVSASKAAEKLTSTDPRRALVNIRAAFYEYIGDLANTTTTSMTASELSEIIGKTGTPHDAQATAAQAVREFERLEYGGAEVDMAAALQAIAKARTSAASLENGSNIKASRRAVGSTVMLLVSSMSLVAVSTRSVGASGLPGTAEAAGHAFDQGEYGEAVRLYEEMVGTGTVNGHLYYNLANAYFRSAKTGQAAAALLAARQYLPRDPDVRANLKHVMSKINDKLEPSIPDETWRSVTFWLDMATAKELAHIAAWVAGISGFFWLGYLLTRNIFCKWSSWIRSEERRVGKECRSRWSPYH